MSPGQWQAGGEGVLALSGELTRHSIPELWKQAPERLQKLQGEAQIDLAGVTRMDSAGVAFLLECQRFCLARSVSLRFAQMPEHMRALVELANLQPLFASA